MASHAAGTDPWQAAASLLPDAFVFQALNMLLGIGFGLLFLNTPVAIVVYFALPTAWSILTGTVSALQSTGNWLDPTTAWGHLSDVTIPSVAVAKVAAVRIPTRTWKEIER